MFDADRFHTAFPHLVALPTIQCAQCWMVSQMEVVTSGDTLSLIVREAHSPECPHSERDNAESVISTRVYRDGRVTVVHTGDETRRQLP